jgi:putative nucleotidyltransferase with HDIG domain
MAQRSLDSGSCTISLANGHGYRIFRDSRTARGTRQTTQLRTNTLRGPAAWVMAHRRALVLNSPGDWPELGAVDSGYPESLGNRILCAPIEAEGRVLGTIEAVRRGTEEAFTDRDLDTVRVMGAMAGIAIENSRLRQSVEESYRSTIRALASAIDAKDPYTCGHSQSVAQYALVCGMVLHLDADYMQTLETAALLHDIGKIGIDDAILRKPRRLTQAEHAIIKDHPVIGAAIVHDIGSLTEVVELILHHHEAYDGSGYPHGLKGENIPLGARIIGVADAFDSMTTDRPYRRGMTINDAMRELLRCRGKQFCPVALDAFAVGFTRYYDDLPRRPRVLEQPEKAAIPAYTY